MVKILRFRLQLKPDVVGPCPAETHKKWANDQASIGNLENGPQ
jgi:hypothetical protein